MKKVLFFMALAISMMAAAADEVATITISGTVTSNKTLTDSKGNEWAFVADPASSLVGETGAIKLGTGSKNAKSLSFESSAYNKKWVKSIEIEGYSNENSYDKFVVYPYLYVHDSLVNKGGSFYGSAKLKQTLTNANKVTGKVRFTMERQESKKKAIFFYSAKITYSDIPQEVNSVTLDKDTLEIKELTSGQLIATVDPNTVTPEWVSLDETIATVKDGIVRGESEGTTLVIAQAEDKADTCVVIVTRDESITTRSFQIVFNSGTATQEQSYTTLDDLIFSGKKYVESFDKEGYSILASNDQGVRLASNNQSGQLTLHLAATTTMHFDSIRVFTKGHADKNTIKVNGQSQQTSTTFTGYKFTQSDNDVILRAETGKQVYVSKLVLYYREYTIVEPTALTLDKDTIVVEKGLSDTLTATILPSNATERDVTWTCNSTDVETTFKDKTAIFKGIHITKEPIQVICTSTYSDQLADTCYVIVKDRTLKEPVYTLMTSTDDLKNGDQIIIARQASEKLMGVYTSGNNIPAVTGIFSEDKTRIEEGEAGVYTLEIIQKGVFAFKDKNGKYLCYNPSASNANNMQTQTELNNNSKWTCSEISAEAMCSWATIGTTSRFIQYNSNADIFACYTNYGNVYIYYRHDENAGSITPEPETIAWEARIKDSAAHFSQEVTIAAEHLAMEMEVKVVQDSIVPQTYPETRIEHKGVFAASVNELPAEGGKVTVTFDIQDLVIVAADTTITANLVLTGLDNNTDLIEKTIPITVKLLREPKKILPVKITTMLSDSINQMGGVHMQSSTKEIAGKDTFLLDTLTVLYVASYEVIVKDETGYLAINSKQSEHLKAGDIITGVRGRLMGAYRRYYFNLAEATIEVVDSTQVAPEEAKQVPAYPADMSKYLRYDSVKISGSNIMLLDSSKLLVVEDYGVKLPTDGEPFYQVEGVASIKGKNIQLILTKVTIDPNFKRAVSGIRISKSAITINSGDDYQLSATVLPEGENPTGAYNKNVHWSTDDIQVVKIDAEGNITGLKAGTAHVIVTADDKTKGIFTDTCTVTVLQAELMLPKGAKMYELVTNASSLKEGDTIILVSPKYAVVMGLPITEQKSTSTKYYFDAVDSVHLYSNNGIVTCVNQPNELRLEGSAGKWQLLSNNYAIGMTTTENNNLHADGTGDTDWSITITDSVAKITNSDNSAWSIQYNASSSDNGGHRFSNYKSAQAPVRIYRDTHKRTPSHIAAMDILLGADTLSFRKGADTTLTVVVLPASCDEDEKQINWSVRDGKAGLSVSKDGVISASQAGEYDVIATLTKHADLADTCHIIVTDSVHVNSIAIFVQGQAVATLSISEIDSAQVTAQITPANADEQRIIWSSSNTAIATVDEAGMVRPQHAGTAVIRATSPDRGVAAQLQLTITELPGKRYTKVVSLSELENGDTIIMVNKDAKKAAVFTRSDKKITDSAIGIDLVGNQAITSDATPIIIEKSGSAWTLTTASGFGITAKEAAGLCTNGVATWTIAIENENALITNTTTTYGTFQYNSTSGGRFRNYTSTQAPIQIYKNYANTPRLSSIASLQLDTVTYVGETIVGCDSFMVYGYHLTDSIRLTVAGEGFSIAPTALGKEMGGQVIVHYAVNSIGKHDATVTISSPGAKDITVAVSVVVKAPMTIAEFIASEPTKSTIDYETIRTINPVAVTFQSGDSLYVRDQTGNLLVRGMGVNKYANGTVLNGLKGSMSFHKYNPQMKNASIISAQEGAAQTPDTLYAYPTSEDLSDLVVYQKVRFNSPDSISKREKGHAIYVDGEALTVYMGFSDKVFAVDTSCTYDVTGIIQLYGEDNYQLLIISATPNDKAWIDVEKTSVIFPDKALNGGFVSDQIKMSLRSDNVSSISIESDGIFTANYSSDSLTISYMTNESGVYNGTIRLTGVPFDKTMTAPVVTIHVSVNIVDEASAAIIVDTTDVTFDPVQLSGGIASGLTKIGYTLINQTESDITITSNSAIFSGKFEKGQLVLSYRTSTAGNFLGTITLTGKPLVAGLDAPQAVIHVKVSVQYEGVASLTVSRNNIVFKERYLKADSTINEQDSVAIATYLVQSVQVAQLHPEHFTTQLVGDSLLYVRFNTTKSGAFADTITITGNPLVAGQTAPQDILYVSANVRDYVQASITVDEHQVTFPNVLLKAGAVATDEKRIGIDTIGVADVQVEVAANSIFKAAVDHKELVITYMASASGKYADSIVITGTPKIAGQARPRQVVYVSLSIEDEPIAQLTVQTASITFSTDSVFKGHPATNSKAIALQTQYLDSITVQTNPNSIFAATLVRMDSLVVSYHAAEAGYYEEQITLRGYPSIQGQKVITKTIQVIVTIIPGKEAYMTVAATHIQFDNTTIKVGETVSRSKTIRVESYQIKSIETQSTDIFSAIVVDLKHVRVSYTATQAGTFDGTITLRGIPQKDWQTPIVVELTAQVVITAEEEGLEQTLAPNQSTKILRDGQIWIIRGEDEYNIIGIKH